jgi:hypothetical protein
MYAISHAATALVLKRRYPDAGLWPLLICVQLVELIWVVLTYLGIEHIRVVGDTVHLDFLPYSHSVLTGLILGLLVLGVLRPERRRDIGIALALGVLSHILLDIIHHEPDIHLWPLASSPSIGFGLVKFPLADFLVETAYCIACWRYFRGSLGLLGGIVLFNLLDLPTMFPRAGTGATIAAHPGILTSLILIEIVLTWIAVWWLSRKTLRARLGAPTVA